MKLLNFFNKEYIAFVNNIEMIDNWIEKKCPVGTHSEWDMIPVIETEGIRENHAYNNFNIYDKSDSYRIIFGIKVLGGIDGHCQDIRDKMHEKMMNMDFRMAKEIKSPILKALGIMYKRLPHKKVYKTPSFEEDRYWVDNRDQGFEKVSRYEFYKFIKEKGLLDYFNFKMEELILQHV